MTVIGDHKRAAAYADGPAGWTVVVPPAGPVANCAGYLPLPPAVAGRWSWSVCWKPTV
jgi:hypothetical protein